MFKGPRASPVLESNVPAFWSTRTVENDTKQAVRPLADGFQVDGGGDMTHMKPMAAVILMMANINSASPYPLTPSMLMAIIKATKRVTKIARGSDVFQ